MMHTSLTSTLRKLLVSGIAVALASSGLTATAQSLSPWQINEGSGPQSLATAGVNLNKQHGNPAAYKMAEIPAKNDPNWKPAPMTGDQINFSVKSAIPCFTQVDFTYFRAYLDIPASAKINKLTATIGSVDDGARFMIFNSKYPTGFYQASADGRLAGANFVTDFSTLAVPGEINTLVVVQFDDCGTGNNLTGGIRVALNDLPLPPDPAWNTTHAPFIAGTTYAPVYGYTLEKVDGDNQSYPGGGMPRAMAVKIKDTKTQQYVTNLQAAGLTLEVTSNKPGKLDGGPFNNSCQGDHAVYCGYYYVDDNVGKTPYDLSVTVNLKKGSETVGSTVFAEKMTTN